MKTSNGTNGKLHHHHGSVHGHPVKHTYHAIHKLLMSKGNQHAQKEDESETMRQSVDGSKKSIFHHYHKANIVTEDYASKQRTPTVEHRAVHVSHHLKK